MVSRCAALILLAVFTFFPLRAFDSCIHIDTERAKMIPGWQDLQKVFYPELAAETEAKLKQQGIELPLTGFSMLSEGDAFELHLEGLTEKQLDFLQEKLQLPQGWEALLFMHRCPHKNGDNVNAPEKHPSFHRFEKIVIIDRTLMVAQKVSEIDQGFGTFPAIDFFHILFHAHLRFLRLFSITINFHLTIKQKACQHEKEQFHGGI